MHWTIRSLHPRYWRSWCGISMLYVVSWLPLSVQRLCSRLFAKVLIKREPHHLRRALANLAICMPQYDEHDRQRIAHACIANGFLGLFIIGQLRFLPKSMLLKRVVLHGDEHVRTALATDKNVFLVGIHQSCFTLVNILGQFFPMYMTFKRKFNVLWDEFITQGVANRYVDTLIDHLSIHTTIRRFKQPHIYWIAADLDLRGKSSVFAPLFGRQADTATTIPRLAKMTDSVILPISVLLQDDNKFHIYFSPPIDSQPNADLQTNVAIMNEAIAQEISRCPEQYLWTYPRFRTQPEGVVSPYE